MIASGSRRRWLLCSLSAAAAAVWPGLGRAGAYEDFFRAIELDNARAVGNLLAQGLDPNTLDPQGQHGLYLALRAGSQKAFDQLVGHPAVLVDRANAVGETALMMASLRANIPAMRRLVSLGAAVNRSGWTPLHYGASSPEVGPVNLLLELGAALDARAPNGNTPLMLAARYGHEDSTRLLLERGADRSLRNERGHDAASYARLDGREAVARLIESWPR